MISVTGGTNQYILQPGLVEKHKKTLDWLSQTILWKTQLNVFQKLLDALSTTELEEKKELDHFQNLVTYYSGEVVDEIRKKLRSHENRLAEMLKTNAEWEVGYFREHDALMEEAEAIKKRLVEIRNELTDWSATLKHEGR